MLRAVSLSLISGIIWSLFTMSGVTQVTSAASGEQLFQQHCMACHPNGGNTVNPNKPLKGSPAMQKFDVFLTWIRKPDQPMPPFPSSKISDQKAKELYDYLLKETKGGWK